MRLSEYDGRRASDLLRTNSGQTFSAGGRYDTMGAGGDVPGWLEAAFTVVGVVMGIITGAITAAWRISSLIAGVEKRLMEQSIANREAIRNELASMHRENRADIEKLSERARKTEQDVAVIAARLPRRVV